MLAKYIADRWRIAQRSWRTPITKWRDCSTVCDPQENATTRRSYVIAGDNGASAEGGLERTFSENVWLRDVHPGLQSSMERLEEIGGPGSELHIPVGWVWAINAMIQ